MTPIENYCRQFHTQDVLSEGKCGMCGGTSVFPHFWREDSEPSMTENEAIEAEQSSHLYP
jgi:hypothetical protein